MRFGCHLAMFGPVATRHSLLAFARHMEALGDDSLWASDHVSVPHALPSVANAYGEQMATGPEGEGTNS